MWAGSRKLPAGLEPATHCLENSRSVQLSYESTKLLCRLVLVDTLAREAFVVK